MVKKAFLSLRKGLPFEGPLGKGVVYCISVLRVSMRHILLGETPTCYGCTYILGKCTSFLGFLLIYLSCGGEW